MPDIRPGGLRVDGTGAFRYKRGHTVALQPESVKHVARRGLEIIMTKIWILIVLVVCMAVRMNAFGADPEAVDGDRPEDQDAINLGLSLRGDYTDNRDATETDTETDKESTFDFYVTPRIDVFLDSERTTLNFFYEPSLRYRENPIDIQNDVELLHDLGLNLKMDASERTHLRLLEKLDFQDDPSIEEGGSTVRDNRSYILNRVELGLRQDINPLTHADVLARNTLKRYDDDDVADESDEDRNQAELLLWRQVTRSLAVHGMGGISLYSYESALGIDRDFDVMMGSAGAEMVFSPQVRGGLDVGAQSVSYSDDTLDSEVFPYALADITLAPQPAFRIHGSLGHGVRDADVYPFASQEYTEFRGGVEVDTSAIVTVGVDGTYRVSTYSEDTLPAGAPLPAKDSDGDETTTVVTGHVAWKLKETAQLRLRQMYEDISSDVAESFQKNTSSVELHLDF